MGFSPAASKNVRLPLSTRAAEASEHPVEAPPARVRYLVGSLRLVMGAIFLWAFLDKLFGLGFATAANRAWIAGGSPTYGFLSFGTHGPFEGVFKAMAGNAFVDALFMAGLLGIGVALLVGIGVRVAAVSGALLMMLMWSAALPPGNHPFLDDHVVYAIVLLLFPALKAGRYLGLGAWWERCAVVQRHRVLE